MWMLILEGLAIGGLLGLTGAGGGILAVPVLMASQGWTVAQAAPVGLLAVTLSALVGKFVSRSFGKCGRWSYRPPVQSWWQQLCR